MRPAIITSSSPALVRAIIFVLKHEGGYVNNPKDPGGETKYGISKRSYPDVDIPNLTMDKARRIYVQDYWDYLRCSEMAPAVAMMIFDTGVNCGKYRTAKWLQIAIRVFDFPIKIDGIIGPRTVAVSKKCEAPRLCLTFLHQRLFHHLCLGKKYPEFISGWINRTSNLMREIAELD